MAKSIADELMERRASLITKAQDVAQRGVAEGRDLTVEEQSSFDKMIAEAGKLAERASAIAEGEKDAHDLEASFRSATGREPHREENREAGSGLGKWAREARIGDTFVVDQPNSAEMRAILKSEQRNMAASGGVGPNSVASQLWEYAVHVGQVLQSGVDIINTADGNSLPFPRATVHASTDDVALAAHDPFVTSESTINTVDSTVSKYGFISYVPTELVQDATFDLEGYIARNAGRQLGRRVSQVASAAIIAGYPTAGVTAPATVDTDFGDQSLVGQGSDLLVKLFHSVLPEYRTDAAWLMADPTAALVRLLKATSGEGVSVWQPSLTAGNPDLILGKSVYIDPQIATAAASAKTVFFGDLSSTKVRIAGGVRFERSDEYKFGNDQISFRAAIRCGAVVLDPNAVKYLQMGTAV